MTVMITNLLNVCKVPRVERLSKVRQRVGTDERLAAVELDKHVGLVRECDLALDGRALARERKVRVLGRKRNVYVRTAAAAATTAAAAETTAANVEIANAIAQQRGAELNAIDHRRAAAAAARAAAHAHAEQVGRLSIVAQRRNVALRDHTALLEHERERLALGAQTHLESRARAEHGQTLQQRGQVDADLQNGRVRRRCVILVFAVHSIRVTVATAR
jgi:hypothetical protein